MIKYLKKWNWTLFLVIVCLFNIGLLSNEQYKDVPMYEIMLVATGLGSIMGLFAAWLTKEE